MEKLEKYINENLEQISSYEMPQGHKERFKAKLAAQEATAIPQQRKISFWNRRRILSVASVAAVVAIGVFAAFSPAAQEMFFRYEIKKYAEQIYIEESQIMQMLGEDEQYMINNLKTITEDAIPLEEQLPAELPLEKKAEILLKYYKAKSASLKNFRTLYAHGGETETEY